jgi:hypothetical protein
MFMRPAKCGTSQLAVWVSATYRIRCMGFVFRILGDAYVLWIQTSDIHTNKRVTMTL